MVAGRNPSQGLALSAKTFAGGRSNAPPLPRPLDRGDEHAARESLKTASATKGREPSGERASIRLAPVSLTYRQFGSRSARSTTRLRTDHLPSTENTLLPETARSDRRSPGQSIHGLDNVILDPNTLVRSAQPVGLRRRCRKKKRRRQRRTRHYRPDHVATILPKLLWANDSVDLAPVA